MSTYLEVDTYETPANERFTGNPQFDQSRRSPVRDVIWGGVVCGLIVLVAVVYSCYRSERNANLRGREALKQLALDHISSRGGALFLDLHDGSVRVSFAHDARIVGCGQTRAVAPTGSPASFDDDDLALLDVLDVRWIQFKDSGVSREAIKRYEREHPHCEVIQASQGDAPAE